MGEFLFSLMVFFVIIRWALVLIIAKQMVNIGASESSFHVVSCYIFISDFDISLLIPRIKNFVLIFF